MNYKANNLHTLHQKLKERLTKHLPGVESHLKMVPADLWEHLQYTSNLPSPKKAAVLITLFPHNDNISTLLIMRAADDKVHGGQIGFPGGRCEPEDPSLEFTALREANEEVGILPGEVSVVGTLSNLYIRASNFLIKPVVAISYQHPDLKLNHSEVQYAIIVCLQDLLHSTSHRDIHVRKQWIRNVPAYVINDHVIWGATAMMISELLDVFPTQ